MGKKSQALREQIFTEELFKLKVQEYIDQDQYKSVREAYRKFQEKENVDIQKPLSVNQVFNKKEREVKVKKESVIKKKLTPEEVRERNITWSLILGVILLLIGGLVLATSNWEKMTAFMKVSSIAFVSVFFLVTSWISRKLLKLELTAFAFLTLGSLFIPIVILSAGYFQLFGDYLSLHGDGKYLLGLLGVILPLPLYVRNALIHKSRMFIWISYLFLSLSIGFLLAAINLPTDAFYLGIVLYNAILLFLYHKFKEMQKLAIFFKELPLYSQLNLVVSTLLMLMFFDTKLFYSFNVLLTAVIYISMVFVYNQRYYHFVFSALIMYGVYQLVENSALSYVDEILYACVGLIYIGFQYFIKNEPYLKKMFQYTSGIISFFAFIYISAKGIFTGLNQASLLLVIAYLLIFVNYTYLAYLTHKKLFSYLAPIFFVVAGLEVWQILDYNYGIYDIFEIHMFFVGVILYVGFYSFNKNKYFTPIKQSSLLISVATMVFMMLIAMMMEKSIVLSIMFILMGAISFWTFKISNHTVIMNIATWSTPICWVLGFIVIFPEIANNFEIYKESFNFPFHIGISAFLLMGISFGWRSLHESKLEETTFFVAQAVYTFCILTLFVYPLNEEIVRPLLYLLGIAIYVLLVKRTGWKHAYGLVSVTTLFFYFSLISTFHLKGDFAIVLYGLMAPVFLLSIYELVGRRAPEIRPYFFWLAHLIQPCIVGIALVIFWWGRVDIPYIYFIPMAVFMYSIFKSTQERYIKLFLYLCLTMIPIVVAVHGDYFGLLDGVHVFTISIVIMSLLFLGLNAVWKKRLGYYIIPFSIIGLIIFLISSPYVVWEFYVFLAVVIMTLYILHHQKWGNLSIVPLVLSIFIFPGFAGVFPEWLMLTIAIGAFFSLKITGELLYKRLYKVNKETGTYFDWYTVAAVLYLLYMNGVTMYNYPIYIKVMPLLLFSYLLFSQVNRFSEQFARKTVFSIAVLSVLAPFYLVVFEYEIKIPSLIFAEIKALPWLAATIFLSVRTWNAYKNILKHVQLGILLIITAYLMVDALISNTVWDAVIMGSLALASVIAGMHFKIKSYFFVGVGVLLLNVFLQTKPYWGRMPWWAYLLIAGSTLIGIASFNEWQKQKKDADGTPIFQAKLKKIFGKFKEWD